MTTPGAPLTRLYLFCAVCGGIATIYGLFLLGPAPFLGLALLFGPPIAVAMWIAADTKHTRVANVADVGWLLYLGLPVTIPWYAVRTRGRSGWRLAFRLYALALAGVLGFVCGALIHFVYSVIAELAA